MWEDIVALDSALFKSINNSWLGNFDRFWLFVTKIEHWFPLYMIFFFLLFKKLSKPLNYVAMTAIPVLATATLGLTNLVKNFIERLRPNNEPMLMDSIRILQTPQNFSFWSGHSAVSFAVTAFVYFMLQKVAPNKWYLLFFIWPVLFASSRIFNGVHYPTDVFVGSVVGFILGFSTFKLVRYITNRLFYTT